MKKVVINKCYGGFGLSEEAYKYLGLVWDGYGFEFSNDRENPKLIEVVEQLGEKASDELLEENVEYRREIIELRSKYRILESIILNKDKGITITNKYNMIKKELGLE